MVFSAKWLRRRERGIKTIKGIFLPEGTNSRVAPETFMHPSLLTPSYCPQIPFAPRILLLEKHLLALLIPIALSLSLFSSPNHSYKSQNSEKDSLIYLPPVVTELQGPILGIHMILSGTSWEESGTSDLIKE